MKKIMPGLIASKILLPSSKSYSNRLLILGALESDAVTIYGLSESNDTQTLLRILKDIGLDIRQEGNNVTINNSFPDCEHKIDTVHELDVGEGGTTARFLCALLSKGRNSYRLKAQQRMVNRPMEELYQALADQGLTVKREGEASFPVFIKGPSRSSNLITIDSTRSSQFSSALMMVNGIDRVEELNGESSRPYVELTKNLVRKFKNGLREFRVPVDFSSLSYPAVFAVLKQNILIENCKEYDSFQADSALLDLFSELGVQYQWTEMGLEIKKLDHKIKGFTYDCSQCPDLAPALCFFASYCGGVSTMSGLRSLRHKESDRVAELQKLLEGFEVEHSYCETKGELTVKSREAIAQPVDLKLANDHRIVMTAYLFMRYCAGGTLSEEDAVEKSFPQYFKLMEGL